MLGLWRDSADLQHRHWIQCIGFTCIPTLDCVDNRLEISGWLLHQLGDRSTTHGSKPGSGYSTAARQLLNAYEALK